MSKEVSSVIQGMEGHVQRTMEMLKGFEFQGVSQLVDKLHDAYETGKRVFIFGNGGSAAAASHFAEDLAKGIIEDVSVARRLRVLSLSDSTPFLTALGNDWGYDCVYREQLVTNASSGDVAIGISGSGNSPNILRAIEWAKENGLFTCGLTGFDGGKLKDLVDLNIHFPIKDMEVAENCHLVVVHLVVSGLRTRVQEAAAAVS